MLRCYVDNRVDKCKVESTDSRSVLAALHLLACGSFVFVHLVLIFSQFLQCFVSHSRKIISWERKQCSTRRWKRREMSVKQKVDAEETEENQTKNYYHISLRNACVVLVSAPLSWCNAYEKWKENHEEKKTNKLFWMRINHRNVSAMALPRSANSAKETNNS